MLKKRGGGEEYKYSSTRYISGSKQRYFSVSSENYHIAVQLDFCVLGPIPGPEKSVRNLRSTDLYQTRKSALDLGWC